MVNGLSLGRFWETREGLELLERNARASLAQSSGILSNYYARKLSEIRSQLAELDRVEGRTPEPDARPNINGVVPQSTSVPVGSSVAARARTDEAEQQFSMAMHALTHSDLHRAPGKIVPAINIMQQLPGWGGYYNNAVQRNLVRTGAWRAGNETDPYVSFAPMDHDGKPQIGRDGKPVVYSIERDGSIMRVVYDKDGHGTPTAITDPKEMDVARQALTAARSDILADPRATAQRGMIETLYQQMERKTDTVAARVDPKTPAPVTAKI